MKIHVLNLTFGDIVYRKGQPLRIGMVDRTEGDLVYVRWSKGAPTFPFKKDDLTLRV